jgi:[ribosomal protein S18]-alanine N-acetyltransferase
MSILELTLRYMDNDDLPEVVTIDEASFKPAWPERSYRFEIHESQVSFMAVLEKIEEREVSGLKRILNSLQGKANDTEVKPVIVAYGGLWKIADEAHISTIASHPDYRGKRYGEIVLAGMIGRAIMLEANYIVLEVRVSNIIAQNLYEKYGFTIEGLKPKYYHHDNEDAYDMRLMLTDETIAHFQKHYEKIAPRFRDWYSQTPHPRLGR